MAWVFSVVEHLTYDAAVPDSNTVIITTLKTFHVIGLSDCLIVLRLNQEFSPHIEMSPAVSETPQI